MRQNGRFRFGTRRLLALAGAMLSLATSTPAQTSGPEVIAEWEPALGTIISWPLGIPRSLVEALAEHEQLYVLVRSASHEQQARQTLTAWGLDMGRVELIMTSVQTHWPRDWGPHQAFNEAGDWTIVDHIFEGYPWVGPDCVPITSPGGYVGDNAVNGELATYFGAPLAPFPGYLTGGNFLVDGRGGAFSTCAMVGENQQIYTEAEFLDLAETQLGITNYGIVNNTEDNGIQHIDCWLKVLDEETLLVKRAPTWHQEYPRIEGNLAMIAGMTNAHGRPWNIIRIDCMPYEDYDIAAYCNSLIINDRIYVPMFDIPADLDALETFRQAMPGYEVIGFPWEGGGGGWYYYDALHCRTRALFDRDMLRVKANPIDPRPAPAASYEVTAYVEAKSGAELAGQPVLRYRAAHEETWSTLPMTTTGDANVYGASIPASDARPDVEIQYYIDALDEDGRAETSPPTAPVDFLTFTVMNDGLLIDVAAPPHVVAPDTVQSVDVTIDESLDALVPGTAELLVQINDAPLVTIPLTPIGGDLHRGELPPVNCDDALRFSVIAEGATTGPRVWPPAAPDVMHLASVGAFVDETVLDVDFESGLPADWTMTGLWDINTACGAPGTDGPARAAYVNTSSCTYSIGQRTRGALTTAPLLLPDVPGGGRIVLQYDSLLATENTEGYDLAGVYVDDVRIDAPDESTTWQTRTVDLTAHAGQAVELSWRFDSIDDYDNAHPGWRVDAVRIIADRLDCEPDCPADLNGDGQIDLADLGILLASYGVDDGGDINGDGTTDLADLGALLAEYGQAC
jgi:agmatine deiminase